MLELNAKPNGASAAVPVKDTTEATFMADVIEASREVPLVVDFWATWCGPGKTLGPILEEAVTATKGKVRMVDVDQNQMIAAQLRIQSIPTVYAFSGPAGRRLPRRRSAIRGEGAFIDRLVALTGEDGGLEEVIEAAEVMLAEGAAIDTAETFAAILGENPANAQAYGDLVRAHLALDNLDQAEALLASARAALDMARQAKNAGPVEELRTALANDPENLQIRLDLAQALHAHGEVEAAVDEFLELFRRDREWNDAAAKTQLMTIFDALKPQDPIVLKGRRRLSSMIFA